MTVDLTGCRSNFMDGLLTKSNQIKEDADKLLKESKLIEVLSNYGDVRIVGSYVLNVMLRPDLDVYAVAKENSREKMLQVVYDIFKSNYFDEIRFINCIDFAQDAIGPKGYYIQPHVTIGENRWKLDVWLMDEEEFKPYTEEFLELLRNDKDQEKRLAILRLKEEFADKKKYIKGVTGKVIYTAVLKDNITTPEEFKVYLESRK